MSSENKVTRHVTRGENLNFEVTETNEGDEYLNVSFQVPLPKFPPESDKIMHINLLSKTIIEKFNVMSVYSERENVNQTLGMHLYIANLLGYIKVGMILFTSMYYKKCRRRSDLTLRSTLLRTFGAVSLQFFGIAFLTAFNGNIYDMYVNELLETKDEKEKTMFYNFKHDNNINLTFAEDSQSLKKH